MFGKQSNYFNTTQRNPPSFYLYIWCLFIFLLKSASQHDFKHQRVLKVDYHRWNKFQYKIKKRHEIINLQTEYATLNENYD